MILNQFTCEFSVYTLCCCKSPHSVVANMLDWDVVSEFELQSHYYVYFQTNTLGKGMNPSFPSPRYDIKWSTKVDMPLNKETKPNALLLLCRLSIKKCISVIAETELLYPST